MSRTSYLNGSRPLIIDKRKAARTATIVPPKAVGYKLASACYYILREQVQCVSFGLDRRLRDGRSLSASLVDRRGKGRGRLLHSPTDAPVTSKGREALVTMVSRM